MKKAILLAASVSVCAVVCGCSQLNPTLETIPNLMESSASSDEAQTDSSSSSVQTSQETNTPEPSGESDATEPSGGTDTTEDATESSGEDVPYSTDENGNIIVNIEQTSAEKPSSSSGRMEAATGTYTKGNVTIQYPIIVGMRDTETQDWANALLYQDAISLIDVYQVDPDQDSLQVSFEVSVVYRGEISLVYSGTCQKAGNSNIIQVRAADDLDLTTRKHVRLSDRLSAAKLTETILESGDYEVLSKNIAEDTLREYLSTQKEDFYSALIETADFNEDTVPNGFSYSYLGNVAVIIPLPHMFGDYAEITIVQQTK